MATRSTVSTSACRVTTRRCFSTCELANSGDDSRLTQPSEKVKEAVIGCLIVKEPEFAALAHVGDYLNRTAKIGVGVPSRGEHTEVLLCQIMLAGDVGPDRTRIGQLTF